MWNKNTFYESLADICQPRMNTVSAILAEVWLISTVVSSDRFIYDMQNILDDLLIVVRISGSSEKISRCLHIYNMTSRIYSQGRWQKCIGYPWKTTWRKKARALALIGYISLCCKLLVMWRHVYRVKLTKTFI